MLDSVGIKGRSTGMVAFVTPYAADRSKQAFLFSFGQLWERSHGRLWFWTFTPFCRLTDRDFAKAFHNFMRRVERYEMRHDFAGLRVFQRFQKGDLHVHMVCNQRLYVRLMRRLCCGTGMGQVLHVRKAVAHDAVYLARYMSRDFAGGHIHDWAKLGDWIHTRCSDLVAGGSSIEEFRAMMLDCGGGRLGYMRARAIIEDRRAFRLGVRSYDGVTACRMLDISSKEPY